VRPLLEEAVSSMIQVEIGSRLVMAEIACRLATRRTSRSLQPDSVMNPCNRWWSASVSSSSQHERAAMGSMLLRSPSAKSPRA
jgi:hypothetical protein